MRPSPPQAPAAIDFDALSTAVADSPGLACDEPRCTFGTASPAELGGTPFRARPGQQYQAQILMSVGPRANYGIGGSVQTPEGARAGYRMRGREQIVRALEDVGRTIDLAVPGPQQIDAVAAEAGILAEFLGRHGSGLHRSESAALPSSAGADEGTRG